MASFLDLCVDQDENDICPPFIEPSLWKQLLTDKQYNMENQLPRENVMFGSLLSHFEPSPLQLQQVEDYYRMTYKVTDRSDSKDRQRNVPHRSAIKIARYLDHFPNGVTSDFLTEYIKKNFDFDVRLGGYNFPKDSDPTDTFKLNFLWIPDNEEVKLPHRLVFPMRSQQKYKNSLKNLLYLIWKRIVRVLVMKRGFLQLDEDLDVDVNEMYELAGFWLNLKHWGLYSYGQLVHILHENFDRDSKDFVIIDVEYKNTNELLKHTEFLLENYGSEVIGDLEKSLSQFGLKGVEGLVEKVPVILEPEPMLPFTVFHYDSLRHVNTIDLKENPWKLNDTHLLMAAGDIESFYMFSLIFERDAFKFYMGLDTINKLMIGNTQLIYRPPDPFIGMLIGFSNRKGKWRRGVVTEIMHDNFTVMDVDSSEIFHKGAHDLYPLPQEVLEIPVYSIPCRFALSAEHTKVFIQNKKVDEELARSLHLAMYSMNIGMKAKIHRFQEEHDYITKGVWFISGYLMDIIMDQPLVPMLSFGPYLMRRHARGRIFPFRPKACDMPDDDEEWVDYNDLFKERSCDPATDYRRLIDNRRVATGNATDKASRKFQKRLQNQIGIDYKEMEEAKNPDRFIICSEERDEPLLDLFRDPGQYGGSGGRGSAAGSPGGLGAL